MDLPRQGPSSTPEPRIGTTIPTRDCANERRVRQCADAQKHPALSQTSRPHKTRTAARASLPKITMSNSEPPGDPARASELSPALSSRQRLSRPNPGRGDPVQDPDARPASYSAGFSPEGRRACLPVTRDKDGPEASHRPVPRPYIGEAFNGVQGVFDASVSTA
jgi:hypothetical protein